MPDQRVAILVDCDNANPMVLPYAMRCASASGRVVSRRAYGNHATLANRWKDALAQMAFLPCLQFQYAQGKNTSDIALALDALEASMDQRADSFVIVTSDSDFVYLCHKLRERGAEILVIGEEKTPAALRSACDRFFEFFPAVGLNAAAAHAVAPASKAVPTSPPAKQKQPRFVMDAVAQLAASTPNGRVTLSSLGIHLAQRAQGFKAKDYGYPKLTGLLDAYPSLMLVGKGSKTCTVQIVGASDRRAA